MSGQQTETKFSVDKIIDLIRSVRNDLIKDFLNDQNIESYFAQHFNKNLSKIKIEYVKKELKELLISPVDLTHYASLINYIRESNSASLDKGTKRFSIVSWNLYLKDITTDAHKSSNEKQLERILSQFTVTELKQFGEVNQYDLMDMV